MRKIQLYPLFAGFAAPERNIPPPKLRRAHGRDHLARDSDLGQARRSRRVRASDPLEARIPHRDVAARLELDRERIAVLMPIVDASKRVARRTVDRWGHRHDVSPFAMTCLSCRGF